MILFEWIILLLLGAVLLSAVAARLGVPYPAFLALGGAALAFVPHAPQVALEPGLALALFVAPVLLDAAYDTSLRDLKRNWLPVGGLVIAAVGLTTGLVAIVVHWLVPEMPWAAAVALGAIVAPPDAAAATAVLRQVRLPHRLLVILEGESLLNDASALIIYKIAVGAAVAGSFSPAAALPTAAVMIIGSLAAGAACGWVWVKLVRRVNDVPSHIVLQFVGTFLVWVGADRVGLSGILTLVAYGICVAALVRSVMPARLRVPSYAVWETAVFVANILAFLLIGLQLRPILAPLAMTDRWRYVLVAAAVLLTTILARFAWVMLYNAVYRGYVRRTIKPGDTGPRPTVRSGLVLSWCGMRGIVTLAAALALPDGSNGTPPFPQRDLIIVCAFGVVLGTLVLQGFSIRPILRRFALTDDGPVDGEVNLARCYVFTAALKALDGDQSPAAIALREEYAEALARARQNVDGLVPRLSHDVLRRRTLAAARGTIIDLRHDGRIGDTAFHRLEEDLDWLELSVGADGE